MINKCTELLAKLESGFSALMNATIGKFGQHLSGIFKDSLDCSICKELIVEVTIFKCQKLYAFTYTSFGILTTAILFIIVHQ